jgi:ABC-type dipeptide/oligopeptide/nickel transport system permease subunit
VATVELELGGAVPEVAEAEAPIRVFFRRLMRHRSGQVGLIGVVSIFALAIFGPFLMQSSPTAVVSGQKLIGPSIPFPFGTDQLGRDVLTRVVYGAQLSLTLGLVPVLLAAIVGVPMGVLVGYSPRVDLILMRVMDVMMAIPALVFALAVIAVLGPGLNNVMLALAIAWVPYYVRMARGNVKRAKSNGYVEFAVAAGATDIRIMFVHLLQSVAAPIIVMVTIGIGDAILSGSALSFIGLGAPPPTPEWGAILRDGREFLRIAWWISVFPGLAIVVTVVSFNLLGDALRDTLDPRVRRGG